MVAKGELAKMLSNMNCDAKVTNKIPSNMCPVVIVHIVHLRSKPERLAILKALKVFCVVFYWSEFDLSSFVLWPLYCLSFFDLRLLDTSLVSSHFSYHFQILWFNSSNQIFMSYTSTWEMSPHWVQTTSVVGFFQGPSVSPVISSRPVFQYHQNMQLKNTSKWQ